MNQQRRDRLKARQDAAEAEYRKANLEKFYDERNAAVHDMQKILSEIRLLPLVPVTQWVDIVALSSAPLRLPVLIIPF